MMQTGVGYSSKTDSFLAGEEAAMKAFENAETREAQFVLAFCSGKHQPHQFLEGVRSVTQEAQLIGGAAMGVFTNSHLSYEGFEGSVTVFSSADIHFQTFSQGGINDDEYLAGSKFAEKINLSKTEKSRGLLVFYDTAKFVSPPMLNFATPLFNAIEENISHEITCAGSGLLGNMQLTANFQFHNDKVLSQHVLGVLISGNCKFHTTIMHGCSPASSYKTITKAHGPVVFEIDHKPAVDVVNELFGDKKLPFAEFPLFVTLGLNKGDKFGDFNEEDYANRLCLAVDEPNKALVMFEPDLKEGDEIQLMHRSVNLNYIHKGIESLKQKTATDKPLYYFYINCAGRAKPYAGGELEDAEEVQKIIGKDVPFMGFYSGVEVAKLRNKLQALDWTGVLCAITQPVD